jgi:hypothetical protein
MNTSQRSWIGTATVLFGASVLLSPLVASGQVTYVEGEGDAKTIVVRLTVSPAAAPVPALKHRLVARDIDLEPGNAAPYYYRALMSVPRMNDALNKEFGEAWDEWYATGSKSVPIANLPLDQLRKAVELSRSPIDQQLVHAVTRTDCDWQFGEQSLSGPDVITFLLPEMQESRALERFLTMRTRLAIAEGRHDDAIAAMRMTYRMATDTARPPMIVCGLVGIAEATKANGALFELIAAPNSPNMYWALTELPQPFIDLRHAARFEAGFAPRIFPFLRDAEKTERAPEEWNRLYQQSVRLLPTVAGQPGATMPDYEMGAALLALVAYPHAKARLIEQGLDRAKVEQMAVGQVIAIYSERITQRLIDDFEKLWYVPFWEMRARSAEIDQRLRDMRAFEGGQDREVIPMMTILLPAVQAARQAQVRLDRELAALRVIEALRMYAAGHDGKLPERLDAITEVPIPLNPATGQPFVYRLDGDKGILELPASDGVRSETGRCELSIRR